MGTESPNPPFAPSLVIMGSSMLTSLRVWASVWWNLQPTVLKTSWVGFLSFHSLHHDHLFFVSAIFKSPYRTKFDFIAQLLRLTIHPVKSGFLKIQTSVLVSIVGFGITLLDNGVGYPQLSRRDKGCMWLRKMLERTEF